MSGSTVLREAKPYKPFSSTEEYLVAMKEDLAEWLQHMYPYLDINSDNFFERLWTGVALCKHANAVKEQAIEYIKRKQARSMTRSTLNGTSSLTQAELISKTTVKYFESAKPGTFYSRDNVSNFIDWCRHSLTILECLLFESDDLILQKNEKHFILCLLEVARRGAKFGMPAPMLVQMERQIDREIAADQKKQSSSDNCNSSTSNNETINEDEDDESDLEVDEEPILQYGPVPQIVTNDLKSLDEMVRDLVAQCTCPTQFPMIRVSEGKYKIGDTKVLIFVRILRNHVMVRVGGGWDTLSHYLDKHDPCRCRSQHRTTQGARLVNKPGAVDLHGSQVYYDRCTTAGPVGGPNSHQYNNGHTLGPPMNSLNRSRSRSPSHLMENYGSVATSRRSVSPNLSVRKSSRTRSRSPTPYFTSTHQAKISPSTSPLHKPKQQQQQQHVVSTIQLPQPYLGQNAVLKTETQFQINDNSLTDNSDTTSEVSDEGYRSLGVVVKPLMSQSSHEDDVVDHEHPNHDDDDSSDFTLTEKRNKFQTNSRPSSVERCIPVPTRSPSKSLTSKNNTNTWNGRPKQSRRSITNETYKEPISLQLPSTTTTTTNFNRNGMGRRSVSSLESRRRSSSSSSTSTSPTKSCNIKGEVESLLKTSADNEAFVRNLQMMMKKYALIGEGNGGEQLSRRGSDERKSMRSPRKDSREGNNYSSRIPAPVVRPTN